MKTIMTALLLLLVIAQWNTASAQVSQMRLFSPPRSDQFGGNSRLRDGMFGEISYNYWLITKGKNQTLGWVCPDGPDKQNPYYTSVALFPTRVNTMSTSALGNGFHGGTTLRIGNMIKHHGWEVKSTILQSQRDSYEGRNGSMDINEDIMGDVRVSVVPMGDADTVYYYYNPSVIGKLDIYNPTPGNPDIPAGYFWAWTTGGGNFFELAPMAITFDRYTLQSKISHWDVEANYIFRAHATRVGFFEFTGGVRYMQLDDSLTFNGWLPWRTTTTEETTTGTGTGTTTDTTTIIDPPNTIWNFKAENHLVGPQVGVRYIKKCSGRWSLIADTKFFAGFNTQNLKSDGEMGIRTDTFDPDNPSLAMGVPVGFAHNPGTFRHSQTRTAFSPGIDFSLKANWRLTDAIAFNVGYQGLYLDRTARASLVNNYEIDRFGNLFGINDKVTQSTWMHGVNFEVSINRF
ncbi:MAG: BBP7 family outer membrane beta-barrel protein [Planctomycetaceae bacterium]|nr:BBP7 family outer membrane beta-barrel protein [Planctomycetaceae bacterium]